MVHIIERQVPHNVDLPVHPVLARIYAARGITKPSELELSLKQLLPWHTLKDIEPAVELLLQVVLEQKKLLIVGDFDVDGATSTALAIRALRMLGARNVDYLVPNRFDFGYGLSPELVNVAITMQPDVIMTVDNGVASHEGIELAQTHNIAVLVTDHHLPAATLPNAKAIVNPNQPACEFSSKSACGCTVVFYVMLALRAKLQELNRLPDPAPNLAQLLDLVALATVADVVPLDGNNRILVEQGLRRIRAGHTSVGILALIQIAGRQHTRLVASDFGFALGPRINAAGRLDDMSVGIECLLTDDATRAQQLAQTLDSMNKDRRDIEQGMQQEAETYLKRMALNADLPTGLVLYQADWHQGVIGILASRVKEKTHRPVIALAKGDDGLLKGSARSIAGLHMRDALDEVHKLAPHLMQKFGGHAMAAGLTMDESGVAEFSELFARVCRKHLTDAQLQQQLETDGALGPSDFTFELAQQLRSAGPWGQHFPEPIFSGNFRVIQQRLVGDKHLKLTLQLEGTQEPIDAIWFGADLSQWPDHQVAWIHAAYQLDINEFRGQYSLQLILRAVVKR